MSQSPVSGLTANKLAASTDGSIKSLLEERNDKYIHFVIEKAELIKKAFVSNDLGKVTFCTQFTEEFKGNAQNLIFSQEPGSSSSEYTVSRFNKRHSLPGRAVRFLRISS